jgi:L-ascorbate metabolism protein UlaG (beta-lactamase superfamily)|tara:strand:+ start:206 stop:799 length:594 start_codon:yes stop_codon:yes gene_type:complete
MTVVTDPYPASVGLRVDNRPAEIVTVSNTHPNHNNADGVDGGPKVFSNPGEYEFNGVTARGVMTPLAEGQPQEERNVAFTIEIGGINICHLGDISIPMTTRMIDDLKPIDVVLVPTGGHCTLDMDQVFQTLQDLDAKIVIPMHYKTEGINVEVDPIDNFVRRMGLDDVQPSPRLVVTSTNLGTDMRVVVMTSQGRPR